MKKKVAVIFGGQSAEHDVSIITAHIPIIQSLEATEQFDVWPIYIAKDGSWYCSKSFIDLNYFKNPRFETELKKEKKINLSFDGGLEIVWAGIIPKKIKIDVAFPAMHGTNGEDGSLMGLLRMAQVPFVGCDIFASAVAMDKVLTKQILRAEGVAVVRDVWFMKSDWKKDKVSILKKIGEFKMPLFVKPVHLGSSIGISKVKKISELENAIEVALHYDDKVLVEKGVENLIEVTLPIMGNEDPRPAEVERPLNKTDFFDFSDKYLSGGKKGSGANSQYSEIPAQIEPELIQSVKEIGLNSYRILGCSGIARIDFLIDSLTKNIYVNEVNTLPGSLYHHNWRKAGVSGVELVTKLIQYAEDRFAATKALNHDFNSDILNKVGGGKIQ